VQEPDISQPVSNQAEMDPPHKALISSSRSDIAESALGILHALGVTLGVAIFGFYVAVNILELSFLPKPIINAISILSFSAAVVVPLLVEVRMASRSYNRNRDVFARGQVIGICSLLSCDCVHFV
jgi:flagellar biosynthesis protein FliQ